LRAAEIGADCLLKATKVDGIYDSDPAENSDAQLLRNVSYMEALTRQLKIMDAAAFSLCMENKIPIIVANVLKKGTLQKIILDGEHIGTLVHHEKE